MAAVKAPYLGKTGKADLDEAVFGEKFHMALVHEAARAELNARRSGTASTLTRGEVAMTGAKAFRQKGTGRARAGALSTPQRVGGGIAFGPKPRRYTVKMNRKAHRRALRAALSVHAERNTLSVLDVDKFDAPSTKTAAALLDSGDSTLVILAPRGAGAGGEGGGAASEEAAAKSFRNIAGVTVLAADSVGVADVIGARRLVISPAAAEELGRVAA